MRHWAHEVHAEGRWVISEVDSDSEDAKAKQLRMAKEAEESATNIKRRYKEKLWKEMAEVRR